MNAKTTLLLPAVIFLITHGYSQEGVKKSAEERKLESQQLTDSLIQGRKFVFTGRMAFPQGGRSVNLASRSNFVKFMPNRIECDMPYFGRVYSGAGYGGDAGLQFSGPPEVYTVTKKKKNYLLEAEVKGDEIYKIMLSVGFDASASLTVMCNSRSTISYNGEISPIE
jgi:hypothetical protein